MVRQVIDDQEFVKSFEEQFARRQVLRALMALRAAAGLSQQDIARKLNCTQSRVSKLEAGEDSDLRMGDLGAYAGALGFNARILLTPQGWTAADEVKYHARCIKRHLDHLASLVEQDRSLAEGVAGFIHDASFNLGRIVQDSARTVVAALRAFGKAAPPSPEESSLIRIEKKELEAEEQAADDPDLASCSGRVGP